MSSYLIINSEVARGLTIHLDVHTSEFCSAEAQYDSVCLFWTFNRSSRSFTASFFEPGDSGYNDARRIWNASVKKHPAVIARCSGVADIIAAVNFARENNLLTAIRGGGHNVGGRALCDDGIVIDLSRMRSVHVDPTNPPSASRVAQRLAISTAKHTPSVSPFRQAWSQRPVSPVSRWAVVSAG